MKWMLMGVTGFTIVLLILFIILYRQYQHEKQLSSEWWRVYFCDVEKLFHDVETTAISKGSFGFYIWKKSC